VNRDRGESGLVYGRNSVLECLRAGRRRARKLLLLKGGEDLDTIRAAAAGVLVEETSRAELDRLSHGGVHQGVVLEADPLPVLDLKSWLAKPLGKNAVVLLLDGVTDPHNLGAIVRSAAAMGASAIVLPEDRAAPITATAVKAASGAIEHIDLVRVTNLTRCILQLKDHEFWIAALDPDGDKTLWEADLGGRIGIVIGSEGKGLRRLVKESCDFAVRIPLPGPIPSLNASVSAAIALAECLRRRSQ
jgi:23S rRNA (guanosine2251-2'-O)-methyltransferase